MRLRPLLRLLIRTINWSALWEISLRFVRSIRRLFLSVCGRELRLPVSVFISSVSMGTKRIAPIIILFCLVFLLANVGALIALGFLLSPGGSTVVIGVALLVTLGVLVMLTLVK